MIILSLVLQIRVSLVPPAPQHAERIGSLAFAEHHVQQNFAYDTENENISIKIPTYLQLNADRLISKSSPVGLKSKGCGRIISSRILYIALFPLFSNEICHWI